MRRKIERDEPYRFAILDDDARDDALWLSKQQLVAPTYT